MSEAVDTWAAENSPRSQTQDIYHLIRADILACRHLPGQKLKISELCDHLKASPGAVREGLSRLAAEGLVVAQAQRGFRVAPISIDELHDLTQVRLDIEGKALRLSIEHGDLEWESRVVATYHRFSKQSLHDHGDPEHMAEGWAEARTEFHQALVSACPSPWLLRLRDLLYAQSERYRRLSVAVAQHDRDVASEHRKLMEAALARNTEVAMKCHKELLTGTTRIVIEAAPLLQKLAGEEPAPEGARTPCPDKPKNV
ncbi:MAG: FCD domain-containing protein [Rhodospirillales bacterium]|nr:FCD domain-containing protein [Rhodospirillales bacterium]